MLRRRHLLLLLLVAGAGASSFPGDGGEEGGACDEAAAASWPWSGLEGETARGDEVTVLISGYSERRLPLLRSAAAAYAAHPAVASVVVLWFNPSTPEALLRSPPMAPGVALHRSPDRSLNARFLPRRAIRTRAVAVCDDDVALPARALSFALALFRSRSRSGSRPAPLVGFFGRAHDLDTARREWVYAARRDRYSILLAKFLLLPAPLLRRYSCAPELAPARRVVERARNCEDILMSFVAAMDGAELVLVEGKGVRDWGDPRNRPRGREELALGFNGSDGGGGGGGDEEEGMERVGLSSRGEEHWRKRGECIREFHRVLGEMPLRYYYGRVVEGVEEQGLCNKGGKLVPCDNWD
ncbi:glycosyltransferase family protein 64 C3 [Ananas comosus]|uniref:Glycosyltransferase family protein 64 C3 n=1 Tax=Ananas comosus TaxID=4615 RepID=A0A6P5F8Q6_ANACO|nr:glycosyltransferase family protein 64 C3 [Ananas comosus]